MYFVIEMPLNANNDGPEMDLTKVVKTVYCVWDTDFLQVGPDFETENEAEVFCNNLIQEWMNG